MTFQGAGGDRALPCNSAHTKCPGSVSHMTAHNCSHTLYYHIQHVRGHSMLYLHTYLRAAGNVSSLLVLCKCVKFWIESNSYFSIRLDLKRAQLFQIFEYCHQRLTYNRMMPIFTLATTPPSYQQIQQTWSRLLAHYGSPSTETPTTETTTMWCHKNSWIYLASTYYWWLLRPNNISTIQFDSKWKKHYLHSTTLYS